MCQGFYGSYRWKESIVVAFLIPSCVKNPVKSLRLEALWTFKILNWLTFDIKEYRLALNFEVVSRYTVSNSTAETHFYSVRYKINWHNCCHYLITCNFPLQLSWHLGGPKHLDRWHWVVPSSPSGHRLCFAWGLHSEIYKQGNWYV